MTAEIMHPVDALVQEHEVQVVPVSAVSAMTKSEVEAQLDAAHRYKRSVQRFLQEARSLATVTREVAESCIYTLPRDGKAISGPSVRLAEICASSYGNLHVAARIVDVEERDVVAQGVAWDLEKNLRVTVEVRRRIVGRTGRRYSDDMITVTGNAAASIALRNAIFRVIPRAYVDRVYEEARLAAVGDAKTLATRRAQVLERLQKYGVTAERVFAKLEVKGIEDIGLEHIETLIGLGTAIREGSLQVDEAFPEPAPPPAAPTEDGTRISLKVAKSRGAEKPTHDPDTGEIPLREPGED